MSHSTNNGLSRRRGKVGSAFEDDLPLRPLSKFCKKAIIGSHLSAFEVRKNRLSDAVKSEAGAGREGAEYVAAS